ncbi:MAG TPA: phenylalanine--tRNA ligase subunit alpha [Acidimicrobiales bacterium]|nr:phenylalanine--tRNA ligase subunit alpha [Acidimicrobiales bacterium]
MAAPTFDDAAVRAHAADAERRVAATADLDELDALDRELLGRGGQLVAWRRELGSLDEATRRELGRALTGATTSVGGAIAERREALARAAASRRLDEDRLLLDEVVDLAVVGPVERGHRHVVTTTRDELEDVFVALGFEVREGPEVETDWFNFEALNIPPGHPARGMHDTIYVEADVEGTVVLRTHTSPMQVRLMEAAAREGTLPLHVVVPGRVYRRDTPDASHLVEFHQIEGLVVDEGITFADLAGTIQAFTTAYFGEDIVARLRPSYFPFTEPSAEFDITCTICRGARCRTCGQTGWMELGGSGVIDPAVFAAVGIDPERWSGFAFGFGIDRCAFMRHQFSDLRALTESDVRFLRQF